MGLNVHLGLDPQNEDGEYATHLKQQLPVINRLLKKHGIPPYKDPEGSMQEKSRVTSDGLSYSAIHHLRLAAVRRRKDAQFLANPLAAGKDPTEETDYEDHEFDFHLLCHSDCEGFYVPFKFPEVLFDDTDELSGDILGSSFRLLDELIDVAPALGIEVYAEGGLSDAEFARLEESTDTSPLHREIAAWLTLYENARLSVKHKRIICFS